MLSRSLEEELAADPHFRLVINQAVNSQDALSPWIVRRTLRDPAFGELVQSVIDTVLQHNSSGTLSDCGRKWMALNPNTRAQVLEKLAGIPVVRYLVLEAIRDYGNRFKVIAGLENGLKRLAAKTPDEESSLQNADTSRSGALLRFAVASILSVATVRVAANGVPPIPGYSGNKDAPKQTAACSQDCQNTINQLAGQFSEAQKQETQLLAAAMQQVDVLIKSTPPPQVVVPTPPNPSKIGPVDVRLELDKLPPFPKEIKVNIPAYPDTLKVELPAVPSSIKLASEHNLQPLPPSKVDFVESDGRVSEGEITIVYPAGYDDSVSCIFAVSTPEITNPISLVFTRKTCSDDDFAPASLAKQFPAIHIPLNSNPIYVPELDAYVSVEAERGGFLHWGAWHSATVSVQSAAYSGRKVKGQPALAKPAGKQLNDEAASSGTSSAPAEGTKNSQPGKRDVSDARLVSH